MKILNRIISVSPVWTILYVLFTGSNVEVLAQDRYEHLGKPPVNPWILRPQFSPDGRRVAFNSNKGGVVDIYVLDVSSNEVVQITEGSRNKYVPRWSPDGRQIVYHRYWGNPWVGKSHHDLYIVNADGTENKPLITDLGNDMFADWLPGGKGLVFVSNRDSLDTLYRFDFESENISPLIDDLNISMGQPIVHPETGNIVFESYDDGNSNIWLYNQREQHACQLTNTSVDEYGPSFSPDGREVIFQVGHGNGTNQIGIMNIDGSQYRLITNKGNYTTPFWGRDGTIVTMYSEPESDNLILSTRSIYTLDIDGSNMKLIFNWKGLGF